MMRVSPLILHRFDPARADLPPEWTAAVDPGALAAEERELLAAKSDYNVLNAALPDGPERGDGKPRVRLRRWLDEGLLLPEPAACWLLRVDPVVEVGAAPCRMLLGGVAAEGLRLLEHPSDAGVARDRARLTALGAAEQPVLALAEGLADALASAAGVETSAPRLEAVLGQQRFRLWPLAGDISVPVADAVVADGQQRLAAALQAFPEAPVFTALADPRQVAQQPFQRLFTWYRKVDWEAALTAAEEHFELLPAASLHDLEAEDHPEALLLCLPTGLWVLRPRGHLPAQALADAVFLGQVLGWTPEERGDGERLELTTSAQDVVRAVLGGSGQGGLIVRPTAWDALLAGARQGLQLPPRSISVSPRPPSGLMYHVLQS